MAPRLSSRESLPKPLQQQHHQNASETVAKEINMEIKIKIESSKLTRGIISNTIGSFRLENVVKR